MAQALDCNPSHVGSIPARCSMTTLWRAVGQKELDTIADRDWAGMPYRLDWQPFLYIEANRDYARRIAIEWNFKQMGAGFVVEFDVSDAFLSNFDLHNVGGTGIDEYWIPAGLVDEFNTALEGKIRLVETYLE